jgi:hypothetical protein
MGWPTVMVARGLGVTSMVRRYCYASKVTASSFYSKCKSPSLGSNRMRGFFCSVVFSLVARTQRRSCFSAMTPATVQSILLKVLVGDRTAAGATTAGTQRPRGCFPRGLFVFQGKPALGIRGNHLPRANQCRLFSERHLCLAHCYFAGYRACNACYMNEGGAIDGCKFPR